MTHSTKHRVRSRQESEACQYPPALTLGYLHAEAEQNGGALRVAISFRTATRAGNRPAGAGGDSHGEDERLPDAHL